MSAVEKAEEIYHRLSLNSRASASTRSGGEKALETLPTTAVEEFERQPPGLSGAPARSCRRRADPKSADLEDWESLTPATSPRCWRRTSSTPR